MADEHDRTEAPTPKRLQKAREEGNAPVSREAIALAVLVVAALVLFRLLYFVIPFTLALTALGLREIYMSFVNGRMVKGEVSRILRFAPETSEPRDRKKVSRDVEEPTDA